MNNRMAAIRGWWRTQEHRARRRGRDDDERGAALAVAVAIAFVVMILGTVAISGTLSAITQSGVADQQVTSTDAAEAGLQYVLGSIESASSGLHPSFSCQPPHLVTATIVTRCLPVPPAAAASVLDGPNRAVTTELDRCGSKCTGRLPLNKATTYVVQATGTSRQGGPLATKTLQAAISPGFSVSSPVSAKDVAPASYAKSTAFTEALFAGDDLSGTGGLTTTGGDVYSGQQSRCVSSGNDFSDGAALDQISAADVASGVPAAFTGACDVKGDLYLADDAGFTMTSGDVGRSAYSRGAVAVGGAATIGGSVYADGPVALTSEADIDGSIHTADTSTGLTVSAQATVAGDLFSGGPVTVSGKVGGSIYADGPVTLIGADVAGSVYSTGEVMLHAGTVGGDVYAAKTVVSSNHPRVRGEVHAALAGGQPSNLASEPLRATSASVLSQVGEALVSAAHDVNGTGAATTATVDTPTLAYDPEAWIADPEFCGSDSCTADSVDFVTNNDCNLSPPTARKDTLDPNSVWAVIKALGSAGAEPTVLQTDCPFAWGDSKLEGPSLALDTNLAIFDSSGFSFGQGLSAGILSGDGRTHQFFAIVPTSAYRQSSASAGTSRSSGQAGCGEASGPDVDIDAPLTDSAHNIEDFVYTPANVCASAGAVATYGRVYAGQDIVAAASSWNQTFDDIAPWTSTPAGAKAASEATVASTAAGLGSGAGRDTPIWVAQIANPAG